MSRTLRTLGLLLLFALAIFVIIRTSRDAQSPATPPAATTDVAVLTPVPPDTSPPTSTLPATPSPTRPPVQSAPLPVAGELAVHFLDVGQGDATLVQGPDFTFLIDAGRHNASEVVPHLERLGVERLDLLIGTHPHADHIGQLPQVLARFPVGEVWMSGDENTTATYERALDALEATDAAYHEPRAGEVYTIGSARVEVVNPVELGNDVDDNSVGVRIVYGQVAFLFTGDAATRAEDAMIARGEPLQAQVLQLGHHGSRTSTGEPFLRAVAPDYAIWSAGRDNMFGHPHPNVVERLACLGIPTFGTAEHGSITAITDGLDVRLEVDLADGSRGPPVPVPWVCGTPGGTSPTCRADQVDINRAGAATLQTIVNIGPERAQQLIALRPYTSLDDLARISGIGPASIEAIRTQGIACVEPLP